MPRKSDIDALRSEAKVSVAEIERYPNLVERFLKASGIPQSTYSRKATRNPNFVPQLRKGRDFKTSTVLRALRFIAGKPFDHDLID